MKFVDMKIGRRYEFVATGGGLETGEFVGSRREPWPSVLRWLVIQPDDGKKHEVLAQRVRREVTRTTRLPG